MFREIPDDESNCLIVDTDSLVDWMHDDVINAVESPGAQSSIDFSEFAQRRTMTDGTNMLQALHAKGLLQKQRSANVMMTPNRETQIRLDELNNLIRSQQGAEALPTDTKSPAVVTDAPAPVDGALDDISIATNMIVQAKQFEDEAATLRESAYALSPELKPKRGRPAAKKTPATA